LNFCGSSTTIAYFNHKDYLGKCTQTVKNLKNKIPNSVINLEGL